MPKGIYKRNPFTQEHKLNMGISKSKEKHPNWKGGKPKCIDCKKVLGTYQNNLGRCKLCTLHYFSKDKSPHWIKDRTQLKTAREKAYDVQYKYWMLEIKKLDSWKCRIGNLDCKGRLEAHHILDWENFPELRYDINNGITLCHAHHPRGRKKEAELSPYLQQLVAERK